MQGWTQPIRLLLLWWCVDLRGILQGSFDTFASGIRSALPLVAGVMLAGGVAVGLWTFIEFLSVRGTVTGRVLLGIRVFTGFMLGFGTVVLAMATLGLRDWTELETEMVRPRLNVRVTDVGYGDRLENGAFLDFSITAEVENLGHRPAQLDYTHIDSKPLPGGREHYPDKQVVIEGVHIQGVESHTLEYGETVKVRSTWDKMFPGLLGDRFRYIVEPKFPGAPGEAVIVVSSEDGSYRFFNFWMSGEEE